MTELALGVTSDISHERLWELHSFMDSASEDPSVRKKKRVVYGEISKCLWELLYRRADEAKRKGGLKRKKGEAK